MTLMEKQIKRILFTVLKPKSLKRTFDIYFDDLEISYIYNDNRIQLYERHSPIGIYLYYEIVSNSPDPYIINDETVIKIVQFSDNMEFH